MSLNRLIGAVTALAGTAAFATDATIAARDSAIEALGAYLFVIVSAVIALALLGLLDRIFRRK